jgi:hypothetical protein
MLTAALLIPKLDEFAQRHGIGISYSYRNDLLPVYVLGSAYVSEFVSRGSWVTAELTMLAEDTDTIKTALEILLGELGAIYEMNTGTYHSRVAEIRTKVFVS